MAQKKKGSARERTRSFAEKPCTFCQEKKKTVQKGEKKRHAVQKKAVLPEPLFAKKGGEGPP